MTNQEIQLKHIIFPEWCSSKINDNIFIFNINYFNHFNYSSLSLIIIFSFLLLGRTEGVEPSTSESQSNVLPLHYVQHQSGAKNDQLNNGNQIIIHRKIYL